MVFVMFCLEIKRVAQAFQQGGHNFHGDSTKEGDTSLPSLKGQRGMSRRYLATMWMWPLKFGDTFPIDSEVCVPLCG